MALYELSASHSQQTSHRPSTCCTARFGHLSSHSFFTRHNPQPSRVRHIVGLLGKPICNVNDNGFEIPMPSPRSLEKKKNFPPNCFNDFRVNNNSILQSITNDSASRVLNNYINGPTILDWRSELRILTETAMMPSMVKQREMEKLRKNQFRQSMYSPSTGRLLPPPSRAMSRRFNRTGSRINTTTQSARELMNINSEVESAVFTILCQILQTEDTSVVQNWLTNASEREKLIALDIVQTALSNKDEFLFLNPSGELVQIPETAKNLVRRPTTILPPISEKTSSISQADYLEVHADEPPVDQRLPEQENTVSQVPLQDSLSTIFSTDINISKDAKRTSSASDNQQKSTWNPHESY